MMKKRFFKFSTILLIIVILIILDTLFQKFVPKDITHNGISVVNSNDELLYGNYEKYISEFNSHFFNYNHPIEKGPRSFYRINSSGFRGGEVSKEKEEKTRIIFIGGSTIFGWEIRDNEKTICRSISKLDDTLEVINAGCPGFTSSQELSLYLFKIYKFNPDILISFGGWSDLHESALFDNYEGTNSLYHWIFEYDLPKFYSYKHSIKKPFSLGILNLLRKSNLFNMIYLNKKNKAINTNSEEYYRKSFDKNFSNKNIQKGLTILKANIVHFQDLSKVKDFKYIYIIQKKNINYINLNSSPVFMNTQNDLFIDSIHLNETGSMIVAEIIYEYLHTNNFLD